jgi:hypothetical protein
MQTAPPPALARAVAINRQPPGPLVTTEWILTEVGDAFRQTGARQKFIRLLDLLREQPDVEIVSSTSDLFRRARTFFPHEPPLPVTKKPAFLSHSIVFVFTLDNQKVSCRVQLCS